MPIAAAMFPKVVSSTGQSVEARRTFHKALLASGVVLLLPAIVLEIFPRLFIGLLSNGDPETLAPLVRLLVLMYLPLPVCTLILNYGQAQGRVWQIAWTMLVSGGGYILCAKFIGGGVERVAYALGAAVYTCVFWFIISNVLIQRKRNNQGAARV